MNLVKYDANTLSQTLKSLEDAGFSIYKSFNKLQGLLTIGVNPPKNENRFSHKGTSIFYIEAEEPEYYEINNACEALLNDYKHYIELQEIAEAI